MNITAVPSAFTACFTIFLASCASTSASIDTLNAETASWAGKPVGELVTKLGPARSREELSDGTTVRQWVSEGGRSLYYSGHAYISYAGGINRESGIRTCMFNLVSRDEKVTKLFYRVQNDTPAGSARKVCDYFREALQEK